MDKKIVKMTPEQFADYILQRKWEKEECVEFALTDESFNRGTPDYTAWWFCAVISFPGYDSQSLLIDYCGGGFPKAFALDDEEIFKEEIGYYFRKWNNDWNEDDGINVELKEGEEELLW